MNIRITAPFSPALDHMKTVLFRPFSMEKWLALGFCAWLAALGTGGGFSFPSNWNSPGDEGTRLPSFESARQWVTDNLTWLLPLSGLLVVVALAVWALLTWLTSRGHFMFLHGVVTNHGAVKAPWHQFASHAWSLFVFRLFLGIGTGIVTLPLLAIAGFMALPMFAAKSIQEGPLFLTALLVMLAIAVTLITAIVHHLTISFVVPIMYLQGNSCIDAWRSFTGIFSEHLGSFVLYMVFLLLLRIAVQLATLILTVLTCCIAGCILAIPFVGTVLLLPVSVFFRTYPLLFLTQFGEPFTAFQPRGRMA